MIEQNNLEINVDELMDKIRLEVASRKSSFPSNQNISNEINILQVNNFLDGFYRIEALLNNSEIYYQVPTELPEEIDKFPFSIGIIKKVILKIYGFIFKKQRVVNQNLIQALRESLQLNKGLMSRLNSVEQRINSTEQRIDVAEQNQNLIQALRESLQLNKGLMSRLNSVEQRINSTEQRIDVAEQKIDSTEQRIDFAEQKIINEIDNLLTILDNPLIKLSHLLKKIEYYQPLYKTPCLLKNSVPQRKCEDRCQAIENTLLTLGNNLTGIKILDVGSSLGYNSFYFADRKAHVFAIDNNIDNVLASRLISELNGIDVCFRVAEFDLDYINLIQESEYDVVLLLSVIHHIIYLKGLEYTKKMMKILLERVPVIIVELAVKDEENEEKDLSWIEALPNDSLSIFESCQDIYINTIGYFSTHVSSVKRPLYAISKKVIKINNNIYQIDKLIWKAYKDSLVPSGRLYYFSQNKFIKEYLFLNRLDSIKNDNKVQIVSEIANFIALKDEIDGVPKFFDYEINDQRAYIVLENIEGQLLCDILNELDSSNQKRIINQLIQILGKMEKKGLYHNDIRTWNIMVSEQKTFIIDMGLASPMEKERNINSFLWILWSLNHNSREGTEYDKDIPSDDIAEYGTIFSPIANAIINDKITSFIELNRILFR
ncbi:protein kinase [Aphanizomenon sp. CS-733/32]|uniref:protein kinase domain-containing protein n=1 Tax=Aphanizomenon sp. CS-733/32 TaxID=3021715 RepID=UPI00233021B7|nr:RIO1 family regulatory kinase/ATPase [Aphanizomenon sp. CS-733/32]MDB9308382.1 protein kinase [Aphanizomenon sp. CS-733/32]